MPNTEAITILGIDPGTTAMGYGIIRVGAKPKMLQMGVLKLRKYDSHYKRLGQIFEQIRRIIKNYNPAVCAIEAPFYGKNVQSMLKLGRAQGTCIAAAYSAGLEVIEYSPKKIKMAVAGNGNASKEQVAGMLQHILKVEIDKKSLDATDGLAAAVCHYFQLNNKVSSGTSYSGWEAFAKQNPDRIKK